jgi:hypothetical protein
MEGAMRQKVFEFLRPGAQKVSIALEQQVQRELVRRMAEVIVAVWRAEGRNNNERSAGKQ